FGSAYWSVTPLALAPETALAGCEPGPAGSEAAPERASAGAGRTSRAAAVPVGFADDGEYLGGFMKRLVDATLVMPGAVRLARDVESFRYLTLLFLLRR